MDTWMSVRYNPVLRAETQLSLVNPDVLPLNFTLLFYRVLACSEAHLIIIHKPKCLLLNILLYWRCINTEQKHLQIRSTSGTFRMYHIYPSLELIVNHRKLPRPSPSRGDWKINTQSRRRRSLFWCFTPSSTPSETKELLLSVCSGLSGTAVHSHHGQWASWLWRRRLVMFTS